MAKAQSTTLRTGGGLLHHAINQVFVVPSLGKKGFEGACTRIFPLRSFTGAKKSDSVVIVADGAIPRCLVEFLASKGMTRLSVIALSGHRVLPMNVRFLTADPALQCAVSPEFSVACAWVESDVRLVVSRAKTDCHGYYALACTALSACITRGSLADLLRHCPPHGVLLCPSKDDAPAVVADHPLLADWTGAILMGRDPCSAPAYADWFGCGLLPRTYRTSGNLAPLQEWQTLDSANSDACGPGWPDAMASSPWLAYAKYWFDPWRQLEAADTGMAPLSGRAFADRLVGALSPESMSELLEAFLNGLGLFIRFNPPLANTIGAQNAGYLIMTPDKRLFVGAEFSGGQLRASRLKPSVTHVTLIFRDAAALVDFFFTSKPDFLQAMLRQQVAFEGNMNYLLKFAHLLRRVQLVAKGELKAAS